MTRRAIVVGTGFGLRVHVPALRAARFEVAALVGQDAERTTRRAARVGVPAGFDSLQAALRPPTPTSSPSPHPRTRTPSSPGWPWRPGGTSSARSPSRCRSSRPRR